MRKRLITSEPPSVVPDQGWLNLETAATFELTSEDEGHPIESALSSPGRRAGVLRVPERRPSVLSSISRSGSSESIWCSMRSRSVAPRNSFFAGAQKPPGFSRNCAATVELQSPAKCARN